MRVAVSHKFILDPKKGKVNTFFEHLFCYSKIIHKSMKSIDKLLIKVYNNITILKQEDILCKNF